MVKTWHLSFMVCIVVITLSFGLQQIHAEDATGIFIQNISVQPHTVKVGDSFTVTATLVNNSPTPIVIESGTCSPTDTQIPLFTIVLDNHTTTKSKNLNCAGVGLMKILDSGENLTGTSPDSTFSYIAIKSGTANVTVTFQYEVKNQTDYTQPEIGQTISKSFLFDVLDNNTNAIPLEGTLPEKLAIVKGLNPAELGQSPLKQFRSGINAVDVKCKQDFLLVYKSENNHPSCTTPPTALHLLETGWGQISSPFDTDTDLLNSKISGGIITGYHYDFQSKSLVIKTQTTTNGTLTVTIPRKLLDAKSDGQDDHFYVLMNGQEIDFTETMKTSMARTLLIPFKQDTTLIEIIGAQVL